MFDYEEQLPVYTETEAVLIQTTEQASLNYSQIWKEGNFITFSSDAAYQCASVHTFYRTDLMNVRIPFIISSTHMGASNSYAKVNIQQQWQRLIYRANCPKKQFMR